MYRRGSARVDIRTQDGECAARVRVLECVSRVRIVASERRDCIDCGVPTAGSDLYTDVMMIFMPS